MMDDKKYKLDTKTKLTRIAGDVKRVLKVRQPAAPTAPMGAGESAKKP